MSQFVTTTTLSQMRSLGSTAERSVHRLQAVLGREFPAGIGLELAEPVPRTDGSGIDWYTERDEPLVRLTDFPPETSAVYKTRLYQAVQAVLRAAAAHEARSDPAAKSTATALRNAVTFPGDENVWVSGGSDGSDGMLVVTAWGYEKHDAVTSGKGEIIDVSDRQLSSVARQTEQSARRVAGTSAGAFWWRWVVGSLVWLVPLVLAGATAWLLIPACGLILPFGTVAFGKGEGAYCALAAPLPPLDQASLRTQQLITEAAAVEVQLRRHLTSCIPKPAQTKESKAMDKSLGEGHTGKLQVTLSWQTLDDLDLIASCPGGILGGNKGATGPGICGDGVRDRDSNRNLKKNISSEPVENIVWQDDIPQGTYDFTVNPWSTKIKNRDISIHFDLRFRLDGKETICHDTVTRGAAKGDGVIGTAKHLTWNYSDTLPNCNFETNEITMCVTDCKQ
ncbi:TIGR03750 family conjugal transfer protein [Mesorhizobium sp. M0142]|uniref:hypothetical protein n=2 Tax=Mesorhizobium TaxID=68287 RepID=UPI00333CEDE2